MRSNIGQSVVDEHLVGGPDEEHRRFAQVGGHRRGQQALAEILDGHIRGGDAASRADWTICIDGACR